MAFDLQVAIFQIRFNRLINLTCPTLITAVPMHLIRVRFFNDFIQNFSSPTLPQNQLSTFAFNCLAQRRQRVVQPNLCRPAQRSTFIGLVNIKQNKRLLARNSRMQSRIISKTQITAEPDDSGVLLGHGFYTSRSGITLPSDHNLFLSR